VEGRGACQLPDSAARLVVGALGIFPEELEGDLAKDAEAVVKSCPKLALRLETR